MDTDELKENLERIRTLTEDVVPLISITKFEENNAYYSVNSGECRGVSLFNIPDVAVQYAIMGENTELKCHQHDEVEILVVFEGDMQMTTPNKTITAQLGYPIVVFPSQEHTARSTKGCKIIAITVPASNAYPHGS
jgi:mannose-6-phosphate isomerase-like protein (cupin superfamily)